jgi:hypothetical protein
MASPDIIKAVAKQFLAPENIGVTENALNDMHTAAVAAGNASYALTVGNLLLQVRGLRSKLDAKNQADLAAALKDGLTAAKAKK